MTQPTDIENASYVNIAFYKFVTINNLSMLRDTFLKLCVDLNIKGTIILGQEGINSCLVGDDSSINSFIEFMRNDPLFSDIEFKKSYSDHIPFRRMLVKIKKEIIPMGISTIKPEFFTGDYVESMELKKWLDDGDDLVILDTRNDYEVQLGTFRGAINPNLKQFRDFPQWVKENLSEYKNKKIVTFCTGGIRCEKATAFMKQEGFDNVYQVQGGILKYFEETKNKAPNEDNYWDGDCFVFDYRVAVDKNLEETEFEICYNCWATLKPEDFDHKHFKKDTYCPNCYENYHDKQAKIQEKMRINNLNALQHRIENSKKIRMELANKNSVGV